MIKQTQNWAGLTTHVLCDSADEPAKRVYVLFHGFGAPGTDLVDLHQVLYAPAGTAFAFPEAPHSLGRIFGPVESRAWWHIDLERFANATSPKAIEALCNELPEGVKELREQMVAFFQTMQARFKVSMEQTILGGFSQGSMVALDSALALDSRVGGLALLSSSIIDGKGWDAHVAKLDGVPVYQSHGTRDPILPIGVAETLRDRLSKAGAKLSWHAFEGEHGIPLEVIQDLNRFLATV
ncbi:MAG: hypothetical protein IPJ88_12765 [Myxococcales bacterium]|nr:MAG: hypothetical protein IPJ88_12765 [Myxococcales bacterium]